MDAHGGIEEDDQKLLQSALSDAFDVPPLATERVESAPAPQPKVATEEPPSDTSSSSSDNDAWKHEYESQVETWREQSALARERAEKERVRWEALRATEQQARRGLEQKQPLAEAPSVTFTASSESPSPADSRDLVAGESQKQGAPLAAPPSGLAHASVASRTDNPEKWEDIPSSLTSSLPSMSFPEHTETPSPTSKPQPEATKINPPSATVSVFDASLSTQTRAKALFAAVAINLLLPFVNGVMLGFGEIFAKNVVLQWFGWSKPARTGRVATAVGLGFPKPFDISPRKDQFGGK
ncbi:hypothetical protein BDN71DRAFT_1468269 [Pleurotus eryngii]|uniref:Proteophosphoglycan ppg4 n=1 Tax=Pleurotus eryngii TaxID=5323 RepID=A0A9P6A203_PLEER|nr:hypothetical protein BDN71DRAFT_1468269 [Pleurotus eryngii]